MHYPQRRTLAVRTHNCRLLYHGWLSAPVSSTRSRIKRCRNDSWAGNHVVPRILHWILTEQVEKVEKCQIFWVYTYPTTSSRRKGEMCAKFGWDRFRNVDLYKFHTKNKNEQKTISSLYIRFTTCSITARNTTCL